MCTPTLRDIPYWPLFAETQQTIPYVTAWVFPWLSVYLWQIKLCTSSWHLSSQTARRHILEYTIFLACTPTFSHYSVQDNFWIIHILMTQRVFSTKISIDTYLTQLQRPQASAWRLSCLKVYTVLYFLWNPKVNYHVQQNRLLASILSLTNPFKGGYTLVTLPRIVTPYRDSEDGTRGLVTYQKLVMR
jgi:hypothetical protein